MTPLASPLRFLIVGAGPAGTAAATAAAAMGAKVTLVESQIVGGAAHLRDCIPSKTMTATAVRIDSMRNAAKLGVLSAQGQVDPKQLTERIESITGDINKGWESLLRSQGVEIIKGSGRLTGPNEAAVETDSGVRRVEFDRCLLFDRVGPQGSSLGDGRRRENIDYRDAYGLPEIPKQLIVIGSGVTGVEFVHIFESLGSEVTLVVSRQQILPHRDPEVAAVLEDNFLESGVKLLIGARAEAIERTADGVTVICDDGRKVSGTHALLAIGAIPLTDDLGLEELSIVTDNGFLQVDEFQRTNLLHIYGAGDCTGQMLLSSVASMQGRKIARHAMGLQVKPIDYSKVSQAVFTEPEIASVGLEDSEAAGQGRKVRTTKVPFAANARAVLQGNPKGFVKVISDPATGVVLGGTIVGHRASELIGILALAVQARVPVQTLVETLMVHPSLSESISDAGGITRKTEDGRRRRKTKTEATESSHTRGPG